MSKIWGHIALCFALTACSRSPESLRAEAKQVEQDRVWQTEQARITHELDVRGYAQMGTTPDGKPLYMKRVRYADYGWDRVYFTDDSITANEYCGKNCQTQVTTIRK